MKMSKKIFSNISILKLISGIYIIQRFRVSFFGAQWSRLVAFYDKSIYAVMIKIRGKRVSLTVRSHIFCSDAMI